MFKVGDKVTSCRGNNLKAEDCNGYIHCKPNKHDPERCTKVYTVTNILHGLYITVEPPIEIKGDEHLGLPAKVLHSSWLNLVEIATSEVSISYGDRLTLIDE